MKTLDEHPVFMQLGESSLGLPFSNSCTEHEAFFINKDELEHTSNSSTPYFFNDFPRSLTILSIHCNWVSWRFDTFLRTFI